MVETAALRIAVAGANGRMGQALIRAIHENPEATLSAAFESPLSLALGKDAAALAGLSPSGIIVIGDMTHALSHVGAVIDFTIPDSTVRLARAAAERGLIHVIGTTGLSEAQENEIAAVARKAVIVKAGNMSLGVNLLTALTRKVAAALDADFDIEIVEMHHRHKIDAPSGTALMLARAAAEGRRIDLGTDAIRTRDGETGPRPKGHIGFASLRGGDVVGDHTVVFAGDGERIELTHRATDRSIFARGALKAALWARGKPPGLYAMTDVLGI